LFFYFTSEIFLLDFAGVNLTKWAIEYQEFVAEALPLSMKSLLLRLYQAAKYELIEAAVGSKYGLAAKCKWDGLAIVIF